MLLFALSQCCVFLRDQTGPARPTAEASQQNSTQTTGQTEGAPVVGVAREEKEEEPQETEEERKERVEAELARLREELREASSCVNLQPLGCDRNHHRYWLFPNLPGLFVETPSQATPVTSKPSPSPSQTATSLPPSQDTPMPRPQSLPTESSAAGGGGVRWACYATEEELEELLSALDVRGVREKALKEALSLNKLAVLSSLHKFQPHTELRSKPRPSPPGTQAYSSGDQYLELYLREQMLDTEEKIHLGNLGHLRGTQAREQWRELIENSGAAAELNAWRERAGGGEGESEHREPLSSSPAGQVNPSVQALSRALLEVEAGIEHKFLMPPLGTAVDSKQSRLRGSKKEVVKETDVCREQWQASLSQATSFSQVFLHLATLERAVMWSRSLMNVRCRICRRKGGDEFMLLCDGCDHGYHTYCLKPPLQLVPEGDWFCRDCSPVTPVKPRKRTQQVTFLEVWPARCSTHFALNTL